MDEGLSKQKRRGGGPVQLTGSRSLGFEPSRGGRAFFRGDLPGSMCLGEQSSQVFDYITEPAKLRFT